MKNSREFLSIIVRSGCFIALIFLAGCTKDYEDINTNPNAISNLSTSQILTLISKAESAAPGSQWNYQVAENLFADQYAQYFACVATYFPSDRLFIRQDWVGAAFNPMYTDVAPQLQSIFAATDSMSAEHAIASIWWVYTFHRVTDYWGPIPYFNIGIAATSVPYDPQDKIYDDFFKRLTEAATVLKSHTSETPYGSYDIVYGGDVNKWIKFCNTLRLRLALRISKVDPARAKTEAEAAVAGGVFATSPDDDALVQRSTKGSDGNGLSIMSDWNEFRMSASMESVLKGYTDPRVSTYFIPAVNTGTYEGLRNGLSVQQLGNGANSAAANSHVGPRWASPGAGGNADYLSSPQNVMCTAEAYFLRAEGAMNGWNMAGTAQDLYNKGITESMHQWGYTDATAINNYINSAATPVAPQDFTNAPAISNIPIKFNTADANIARRQIATQKWLALFPDGMEAWADYRRSHIMNLYPVVNSENADITNTTTQWLRRIPFLESEKQNNAAAIPGAIDLLGGPDKVTTPLWWDKN